MVVLRESPWYQEIVQEGLQPLLWEIKAVLTTGRLCFYHCCGTGGPPANCGLSGSGVVVTREVWALVGAL